MKRIFLPILLLAFASTCALAAPCLSGSLQSYVNLGATGCEVGAVNFSNFMTSSGITGATPLDPGVVQVTPGGSFLTPTLTLVTNTSAATGDLFDLLLEFRAGGALLSYGFITLNSPTATGDAAVSGFLDICRGGNFAGPGPVGCSGSAVSALTVEIADFAQLSDFTPTGPVSSFFDVFVELSVDGASNGSASLPSGTVGIAAVPEPSTTLLVCAVLAGTVAIRRRRNR
ncbi:MAG TPA: PEP-CTERM sorting domain-containing protein [Bryobacteraceae bacterium]|jgi:hypothetical protein|nr:PEP-CTERM sorting domain-containing protein [Bryobacteraceae bacterium]